MWRGTSRTGNKSSLTPRVQLRTAARGALLPPQPSSGSRIRRTRSSPLKIPSKLGSMSGDSKAGRHHSSPSLSSTKLMVSERSESASTFPPCYTALFHDSPISRGMNESRKPPRFHGVSTLSSLLLHKFTSPNLPCSVIRQTKNTHNLHTSSSLFGWNNSGLSNG